jgi:hypothetical protein
MPALLNRVTSRIDRRIKRAAADVGGPRPATTDQPKYGADSMPHGWVDNPLVFVAIAPDGTVTIVCHRSEMVGFQWILDHVAPDRFHLSGASAARGAG